MEIAANGQPKVLSGVAAYLMVNDANAASQFYQEAFAAQEVSRMPAGDGPRLLHVHLYINGASVMLSDPFPEHGHGLEAPAAFSLHLAVTDVEMWWDRAVKAGGVPTMELQDMFWGDRYGALKDPFGVAWSMGEPIKKS